MCTLVLTSRHHMHMHFSTDSSKFDNETKNKMTMM